MTETDVPNAFPANAMKLAAAGMVIGFVIALGLSQLLKSFLIGIVPADPVAFGLAAIMVFATGTAASLLPSYRATRINPVDTL